MRFGNDPIAINNLEIELGENVILPLSQINQTRRMLVAQWQRARLDSYSLTPVTKDQAAEAKKNALARLQTSYAVIQEPILAVAVTDPEAAHAALAAGAQLIYYFGTLYRHDQNYFRALSDVTAAAHSHGAQCFAAFERVTGDDELEQIGEVLDQHHYDGVLVRQHWSTAVGFKSPAGTNCTSSW